MNIIKKLYLCYLLNTNYIHDMRLYYRLVLFISAIIATMSLAGCELEYDTSGEVITFDSTEYNVHGNGCKYVLYYKIHGRNIPTPTVKSSVEWIEIVKVTASEIHLNIAENPENEQRMGIVTVATKDGAHKKSTYIMQGVRNLKNFDISISDVRYDGCTVTFQPAKPTQYIANIIDITFFSKGGISTEEDFINLERNNYIALAEAAEMSLEEYLTSRKVLLDQEQTLSYGGMQHTMTYLIYCYGVEFENNTYVQTTPIQYTTVELPLATMVDASFSVEVTMSISHRASILVTPNNWSGYYNIQVIPDTSLYYIPEGQMINVEAVKGMANYYYSNARMAILNGRTPEAYLNSTCFKGTHSVNLQLEPSKRYMVAVFAVESRNGAIPVLCSIPTLRYVNTL